MRFPYSQATDTAVRPLDPVVILVAPVEHGRFRASVSGRVLIASSTTPFLDAARVLAGEGVDPATKVVMRHEGKDCDALTSTVGTAAKLDVKGDHFTKYRPRVEGVETADQTAAHASEPVEGAPSPALQRARGVAGAADFGGQGAGR